ncbi:pyrroline-5-carboxylate reductase [Deltaproteobacteria bacterium Smac51]|nr:pyrroline-5-carboxylate reductase [Deltaproteobacteria bacterium Smac51]
MSTAIGFIGGGNITRAILSGVAGSGLYETKLVGIFDIAQNVREDYASGGYVTYDSIEDLVKASSVVVVAVTPQVIDSIIAQIKSGLMASTVLLSVVAGISTQWYRERLGQDCKVVRCMPTLTAHVGLGSFAVARAETVLDTDYKEVDRFLSSCGVIEEIPEDLMCEVVSLNGSAPGYFYHMTRVVVAEAVRMGFDQHTALRLFAQTMKGSAETLLSSGLSAEELEGKLRLAGGTTVAALEKMEELGFDRCLQEGLRACVKRCVELGKF